MKRLLFTLLVIGAACGGALFSGCAPAALRSRGTSAVRSIQNTPGTIHFSDTTMTAGIRWKRTNGAFGARWFPETAGGGCAFLDYDGDGYQDILLVNGDWWPGHALAGAARPTLALYRNTHHGSFEDVTRRVGLALSCQGMGVAIGDYDNDGYDDVYITAVGENHLFHNVMGRKFEETTRKNGVGGSGWSTSAAWLDYDNDGKLDLFVCHYVKWSPALEQFCGSSFKTYCTPTYYSGESCRLYHNVGGKFVDVTERAGLLNANSKALGVCTLDFNGDGRIDIAVANDQEPNCLYKNNGDGTFTDVAYLSGLAMGEDGRPRSGMGIDVASTGNNEELDVLIGNFAFQGATLYRQAQPGLFVDRARDAGILQPSFPYVTFGLLFADFDNDGWKDAALTNGQIDDLIARSSPKESYEQPSLVLQNLQDGQFRDATADAGLGKPLVGRGIAAGDIDNDGRMDLLLAPNIGSPRLLHNDSRGDRHWVKIVLQGVKSNRDGYGAVIRVVTGITTQIDVARSGSSYCSQSDQRLNFGLGSADHIDMLEIRWPSGQVDRWRDLNVDRTLRATEGQKPE